MLDAVNAILRDATYVTLQKWPKCSGCDAISHSEYHGDVYYTALAGIRGTTDSYFGIGKTPQDALANLRKEVPCVKAPEPVKQLTTQQQLELLRELLAKRR